MYLREIAISAPGLYIYYAPGLYIY